MLLRKLPIHQVDIRFDKTFAKALESQVTTGLRWRWGIAVWRKVSSLAEIGFKSTTESSLQASNRSVLLL
jgi:hypothetical protein